MELHQVRYFHALAQSLNFTRAAEQCNVTQPALTKAVQKLEHELGGSLIYRERHLTQLTDLGKLVLPMMERTLAAADAVRLQARDFQSKAIAPLKIGLAPNISATLVIEPLLEISRNIRGIELELVEAATGDLPRLLLEGGVNAALTGEVDTLPDRIDQWQLFDERFIVLTPAVSSLARFKEIPIKALTNILWIEQVGCASSKRFWRTHFSEGQVKIGHRCHQDSQLQQLVAAGLGVMLAPEHIPRLPSLVGRPIIGDPLRRHVHLLVVAGRRFTPALDALIKAYRMRDWTAKHPAPQSQESLVA